MSFCPVDSCRLVALAALLSSCVETRFERLPPPTPVSGLWHITGFSARPGNTLPDPPEVLGITSIEVIETITRINPLFVVHDAEALLRTAYEGKGTITSFRSTATAETASLVWTWEPMPETSGPTESWELRVELDDADPQSARGAVSLLLDYGGVASGRWAADVGLARI